MKEEKIRLLSERKKNAIAEAEQNAINAGVQYNIGYERIEHFSVKIDTQEKRDAIKFLLGGMLDVCELGFQMSPIIEKLGDPETKESLNYREFKLLQEVIKNVRISGRDNHIELSKSMRAFNEDGNKLSDLEQESQQFIKLYQEAGTVYAQTCKKCGVLPDDLSDEVEAAFQKAMNNQSN